jgi:hypothetical protein
MTSGISRELGKLRASVFAREFDKQHGPRRAHQRLFDDGPERRIRHRQADHRAIDQFDGNRPELHDVLRHVHRAVERREVHDAEHFVGGQRRELERELPAESERTFGADQQLCKVRFAIGTEGQGILAIEQIDVVARDTPQHLRHLLADFITLSLRDALHAVDQRARAGIG